MTRREVIIVACFIALLGCGALLLVQAPRTAGMKKVDSIALGATRDEVVEMLGEPLAEIRDIDDVKRQMPHFVNRLEVPVKGVLLVFHSRFTPILVGMYFDDVGRLERKVEIQGD